MGKEDAAEVYTWEAGRIRTTVCSWYQFGYVASLGAAMFAGCLSFCFVV